MRRTAPSTAEATQSAPEPTATALGALPASSGWRTWLAPGPTWATVLPDPSATQSEPAPNASALGSPPTGIATACPESGSIRDTVPSSVFAAHSEPAPTASAAGPRPTGYWAWIRPSPGSILPTAFSGILRGQSGAARRIVPSAASPARTTSAPPASNHARARRRGCGARARGAGGPGRSSTGSWRRTAAWRRRSSGPGSTPIWSTSSVRRRGTRRARRPGGPRDRARASAGRAVARGAGAQPPVRRALR